MYISDFLNKYQISHAVYMYRYHSISAVSSQFLALNVHTSTKIDVLTKLDQIVSHMLFTVSCMISEVGKQSSYISIVYNGVHIQNGEVSNFAHFNQESV